MAKFKCVHSGCVYELTETEAIENMRAHDEYDEEITKVIPAVPPKPKKVKE